MLAHGSAPTASLLKGAMQRRTDQAKSEERDMPLGTPLPTHGQA